MSDVRDWGAFIRGRWNWTRGGYEKHFPRGCQFSDVDAVVEFNGRKLFIEAKSYDGIGNLVQLSKGQQLLLEALVNETTTVIVLHGCGGCNDPYAVYDVGARKLHDWRGDDKEKRRWLLSAFIDTAMGL